MDGEQSNGSAMIDGRRVVALRVRNRLLNAWPNPEAVLSEDAA